jgi:hypothetical protein
MSNFREIADKMCINPAMVDKYEIEIARDDVIDEIKSDGDEVYIDIRSIICMVV